MSDLFNTELRLSEVLPRYLFLEPLITGRRVLEVGSGLGHSAGFLATLQASRVVGLDFDEHTVEACRRNVDRRLVDVRWAREPHWPADDGAFDVAVDFGLSAALRRGDANRLDEITRVLSRDGLLITAVENVEGRGIVDLIDGKERGISEYGLLVETLNERFNEVVVVGQSPFLGFSFIGFHIDPDDAGVALDTALMGGTPEDVAYYVIIAGARVPSPDELGLIQLPFSRFAQSLIDAGAALREGLDRELGGLREENRALEQSIAEREEALGEVAERVSSLRDRVLEQVEEARTLADAAEAIAAERDEAQREIEGSRRALQQLLQERDQLQLRVAEVESQLSQTSSAGQEQMQALAREGESLRERMREAEVQAKAAETHGVEMERQLLTTRRELDDAAASLAGKLQTLSKVNADAQTLKLENAELSGKLKMAQAKEKELAFALERSEERGEHTSARLAELERSGQKVQDQLAHLQSELGPLQAKAIEADALAGELQHARQAVADLTTQAEALRGERDNLSRDLQAMRDEIEASRRELSSRSEGDESLRNERDHLVAERHALDEEFGRVRQDHREQAARIENLGRELEELRGVRQTLEAQLEQTGQSRGEAEVLASERASRLTQLEAELTEMRERHDR
ncbi:MAG: methyltransferase domain-containing protein [Pseudomonadota bacterium]